MDGKNRKDIKIGLKVRLQSGQVGRVQEVLED